MGLSDFHLIGLLKKRLANKRFQTDADVKQAATSRLQTIDIDFFEAGIQALMSLWYKCLNIKGDNVDI
jgi:hypothetical protein